MATAKKTEKKPVKDLKVKDAVKVKGGQGIRKPPVYI